MLDRHLVPRAETARKLAVEHVAQAAPHRLHLALALRPLRVPADPSPSQVAVQEVPQRLRHRVVLVAVDELVPRRKAQRHLTVHQHAQALPKLPHELGTLDRHLDPRTPTTRELAVEHVAQAATHRLHLPLILLPKRMPSHPTTGHVAVDDVAQRLRHRGRAAGLRAGALDRVHPAAEGEGGTAIHHEAQPLAQLLQELRALDRHLDPRAETA